MSYFEINMANIGIIKFNPKENIRKLKDLL